MNKILTIAVSLFVTIAFSNVVHAKSYIKSYSRSNGTSVRSYTRYKSDGYKFNNYNYRPDRGYNK